MFYSVLLGQGLFDPWPALGGAAQHPRRVRGKGRPGLLAVEQIKALTGNQPESRIAGYRHPAGQVDRVVAAELRPVNFRMGDKGRAVALVAETPDRAGLGGLELLTADLRLPIGEIGDGIEPLDATAGKPVHDQ